MRRIAIVGAGQAGLQLALGLRSAGYEVTVVAARKPEEIRAGRVTSTQQMFAPALALEREAGLNLWDGEAPWIHGASLTTVDPEDGRRPPVAGPLVAPAQSVDQRIKTARWLELFEEQGGRVEYREASADDLAQLASGHDLTVVATGRGPLGEVFGRDERHSPFDRPQRVVAVVYAHGIAPAPGEPYLRMVGFPGVGEYFVMPALTLSGPCHAVLWEGVPGGPLDCWQEPAGDPQAVLARTLEVLRERAPWEYELCAHAEPTDAGAALSGAVTPVVRHPVAEVAPDTYVLGMADAVVVNDPITGQGSNNAARAAARYLTAIRERGELPFDRAWMHGVFAGYWEHARHGTAFTNLVLSTPLPEHVRHLLTAAGEHREIAHRYVNGFAAPADYQDWLMDEDRAEAYLKAVTGSGL